MPSFSRTIDLKGKKQDELYQIVSTEIEKFLSKIPLGNIDIDKDASQKSVSVKSKMFSGTIQCFDEKISIDVKLSLMAAPFKSKLDDGITRWLEKHL